MTSHGVCDVVGPLGSFLCMAHSGNVCGLCRKPLWDNIDACFDVNIRKWMVYPEPDGTDPFVVGSALACRMSPQLVAAVSHMHNFETFQCRIILASTRRDLRICFANEKLEPTENDIELIASARGMRTPDETWCVCMMRAWMQHAVRIPRDYANKWPVNGAEFVKIRNCTELCSVLARRGLVLMPEDLDAIDNTYKFRQYEFDLADQNDFECLPYFTQDICGWSSEVFMKHMSTLLGVFPAERSGTEMALFEKCGLSGEAFVTMPNDKLHTMLTESGMSSDIIKYICKIHQTRSWGPDYSTPIPDSELVIPAIQAYHKQRILAFAEYKRDLKRLHSSEFSIAPITREHAQRWRTISEGALGGDMEAIELMLMHAIGKTETDFYLTFKETSKGCCLCSTRMCYIFARVPADARSEVLNTTPLSNWITPEKLSYMNTWKPSDVREWIRQQISVTEGYMCKYTPVLPVLTGKDLFALTPNQFGVRLVIDGVSRISMIRIIGIVMENKWRHTLM